MPRPLRPRDGRATKAETGVLLDAFCQTTGYHRNAAMRLLGQPPHGNAYEPAT